MPRWNENVYGVKPIGLNQKPISSKPKKQGFIAEVEQGNYGEEAWGEPEFLEDWMHAFISGIVTEDMGPTVKSKVYQFHEFSSDVNIFLVDLSETLNDDIYCLIISGEDFAYQYFFRGRTSALEAFNILKNIRPMNITGLDTNVGHIEVMEDLSNKFKIIARQRNLYKRLGKHNFTYR